jgi:outer membrane protein OmpA-like peptidoglycan-associated protein
MIPRTFFASTLLFLSACAATPGPDKTIGGAVLGAAWGAGAGAVIGNQLPGSPTGEGAAIGSGFGLVSGAAAGLGYDTIEDSQIEQENELEALRAQNSMNADQLDKIQSKLDYSRNGSNTGAAYTIYFDTDATSMRSGSISQLETIADAIKINPYAHSISITGHSDDSGTPEHNLQVAEARARSVAASLETRGIATDQVKVVSAGSTKPVATNTTPEGRQLNRRVEIVVR